MKKIGLIIISLFVIVFTFSSISCKNTGLLDAPPVFLEITNGPGNNQVVKDNSVIFSWKSASTSAMFKYRLLEIDNDNFATTYQDWTKYSSSTSVTFTNLDEGKYRFEIQSISKSIESGILSRDFVIDAVAGPSMIFNRNLTKVSQGATFTVSLWLEEVDSLSAFSATIGFDKAKLNLVSITQGELVTSRRYTQLIAPDFSNAAKLASVNQIGKINLVSAILRDISSPQDPFISGSGRILNLRFKAVNKGTTTIEINSLNLRDFFGRTIEFNPPLKGTVVVS